VQHTHTAFSGALAATVLAPLSPVAAQNVILLVWVFLNGFIAYLLAYRVSHNRIAALSAGVVFAGCPAVLVRLAGHFNLDGAWVLPLCLLLTLRALDFDCPTEPARRNGRRHRHHRSKRTVGSPGSTSVTWCWTGRRRVRRWFATSAAPFPCGALAKTVAGSCTRCKGR